MRFPLFKGHTDFIKDPVAAELLADVLYFQNRRLHVIIPRTALHGRTKFSSGQSQAELFYFVCMT
jgi:hypothetical protein